VRAALASAGARDDRSKSDRERRRRDLRPPAKVQTQGMGPRNNERDASPYDGENVKRSPANDVTTPTSSSGRV
jgi:hypothetical protein